MAALTPTMRSALLAALRGGSDLPTAARGAGTTAAAVRREMAEPGAEGEGLARAVAAAVAVGERAAVGPAASTLGPAWDAATAASRAAQEPDAGRAVGTGLGYATGGSAPSKRAAEHTDDGAPDWAGFRREARRRFGEGRGGLYLLP